MTPPAPARWFRALWRGSFRGAALLRTGPRTVAWILRSVFNPRPPAPGAHHAPIPTPALVSEVVLDELVRAAMVDLHEAPGTDESARAAADIAAAADLWGARGWDADPSGYHRSPPPLGDADVELGPGRWLHRRFELLRFESGYLPRPDEPGSDRWAHAGDVVHAAVLRHGDGRDRPWLVCLHGFGMGYTGPDLAAFRADELHRRHLLNVVVPVLPRHGPRRIRNGSALLSLDVVQSVHGLSQAVWDMRRLIGWIRATTGQPVGITGISLGGYTTALVAGLEPVDLAIAGIPAADFPDLLSRHAPPHVRRTAKRHGILGEHADAVARVVSPLAFAPRVPQPRRFIYAGMGDRLAPASHALRLWEHWEQPAIRCYPGGHVGFVWSRPVRQFVTESLAASGFATPNRG